ncbi:MAG TPA: CBS domain-containing protein [Polyangiaceae bacterium]|nr:CBS domain-containing protein [Polyangiaceae bacterium]
MQISAIMERDVKTCGPADSLREAALLMWEGDCGAVPVLDDHRRVVGMITDRDICMSAFFKDVPLSTINIEEVMSRQVHCCRPEQTVAEAEALMREAQVRRVPIVNDEHELVGILSLADIARTMRTQPPSASHEISLAAVGETLAGIARTRNGSGSYL